MNDAVVMIPTLNEEAAIGATIDDVYEHLPGCQVVVIDSVSDDRTVEIAEGRGAKVITTSRGGKGLAVRLTRSQLLLECHQGQQFIMMDGDYTYPAKHIPEMVEHLVVGADVVMGYRARVEDGAMTRMNKLGNWGLSMIASVLYQKRVLDLCTGLWGFRREALEKFILTGDRFTLEADLFVNARRNRCNITQIPIEYWARQDDSAKVRVSDGLEIGWFLIRSRFK